MGTFIAITPEVHTPFTLKTYALLFDQVAIVNFAAFRSGPVNAAPEHTDWMTGLRQLGEVGFLLDPADLVDTSILAPVHQLLDLLGRNPRAEAILRQAEFRACRQLASAVRAQGTADAVAFSTCDLTRAPDLIPSGKEAAVAVTINAFPQPVGDTPWEAIQGFRNDDDARGKFLRLKTWLNAAARGDRPLHDLEDELAQLLFEYEAHMKLHRLKTSSSTLETVMTVAAEVAEALATFNLVKATKIIFSIQRRDIEISEAELKAPGREVAYFVAARRAFGSDH